LNKLSNIKNDFDRTQIWRILSDHIELERVSASEFIECVI